MRERRMGFWLLWGFALCGIAGCSASPAKNKGMLYGALAGGALGIGAGYAIGDNCCGEDSDSKAQGGVIGAAAGALIGATLGYLLAEEEVQAQVQAPPPPPPAPRPAPPAPPAEPKRIVLRGINFDFDKSAIKPEFRPVLDEAARILQDNTAIQVTIEGHTDSIGTDAYNQKLSERRAQAVKQYLVSKGVSADRLETVGKGETAPIAPNTTDDGKDNPEGRAMNRRAELKVR